MRAARRITLLLAAAFLALPMALPAGAEEAAASGPKMVFEETAKGWGLVSFADRVEHSFRFRNEGDAPLVVEHVEVSCGCSLASSPQQTVPPGGAGEIRLSINGSSGPYDTKARVDTNEPPGENTHMLFMSVHFLGSVEIDPPSLTVSFDAEEAPAWRTVRIRNFDSEPMVIARFEPSQGMAQFIEVSYVTVETGREYAIVFHLKETPRGSLVVGSVTVALTRGGGEPVRYTFHVQASPPAPQGETSP